MITFVPDKMKLNRHRQVRCPRPAELAQLHGYRIPSDGSYSGDENFENDLRKTEQLDAAMRQVRESVENMQKQDQP